MLMMIGRVLATNIVILLLMGLAARRDAAQLMGVLLVIVGRVGIDVAASRLRLDGWRIRARQ